VTLLRHAGAKEVYRYTKPIAAANRYRSLISKSQWDSMIVDIGGGTTEIALIAYRENRLLTSLLRVAEDTFSERYFRLLREQP